MDESLAINRALDALGGFVKRTGVTNGARGLSDPQVYRRQQFLAIDPATRKHLELTHAQGQNPRATLLATLDACATSMGSRMLARWILAPLVDVDAILTRQNVIAALLPEHARRDAMREILRGSFDLERIARRRCAFAAPRRGISLRCAARSRCFVRCGSWRFPRWRFYSSASATSARCSTICIERWRRIRRRN